MEIFVDKPHHGGMKVKMPGLDPLHYRLIFGFCQEFQDIKQEHQTRCGSNKTYSLYHGNLQGHPIDQLSL